MIDQLEPDYITNMISKDITLSEIYMNLSKKTGINNFIQVSNHLDDNNLMSFGDVHASNVKTNLKVGVPTIQDDSAPEPEQIGYLYQPKLDKLYSICVYVWELVEITQAYAQVNSRHVTAQQYL